MNNKHVQRVLTSPFLISAALFAISPIATATTTHLCSGPATSCEVTANNFTSGGAPLSGNAGSDTLIIDSGNTASVPNQTYYNFGTIENRGTFNQGDYLTSTYPWLRVMGPGALLDNYGVINNHSTTYVQNNSDTGTGAPIGSGKLHNHSGAVFNIVAYSGGGGELYAWDDSEIINDGELNNHAYFNVFDDASFTNNGTFNNYAQEDDGYSTLFEGAETVNTGTVHNMAGAHLQSGNFHNTATGTFINDGKLESSIFSGAPAVFKNEGLVEITATGIGQAPNFYQPGTFEQTSGSLVVDGQFVQSQFDIQGGTVTGGGTLDTTNSAVSSGPTVIFGAGSVLNVGNGSDNELDIIGDVQFDVGSELVFELGATTNDVLNISGDLDLYGTLTISLLADFTAVIGDTYDTADFFNVGGNFTTSNLVLNILSAVNGYEFNSNGFTFSVTNIPTSVSAVPVPAAVFMFAPALLGFIGLRRKAKEMAV